MQHHEEVIISTRALRKSPSNHLGRCMVEVVQGCHFPRLRARTLLFTLLLGLSQAKPISHYSGEHYSLRGSKEGGFFSTVKIVHKSLLLETPWRTNPGTLKGKPIRTQSAGSSCHRLLLAGIARPWRGQILPISCNCWQVISLSNDKWTWI